MGGKQMRSTTRFLVGGAFVVGFGLGWAVKVDRGVVAAQAPHKPFMMQRVYTGSDGLSHVENIELNAQSLMEKVTGARVSVSQPGSFSDYHVGPERRYIINLTRGGQLQVAEGKVDLPAGSIEYIDDDRERQQGTSGVNPASVRGPAAGRRTHRQQEVIQRREAAGNQGRRQATQ
jgi:hypothetical protein